MAKRQPKRARAQTIKAGYIRVSFILPRVLDKNLELLCSLKGTKKQDCFALALAELLKREGIRPDREAKVSFSYDS